MIRYRRATPADVDALTDRRMAMQREVRSGGSDTNGDGDAALTASIRAYFATGLGNDTFIAHVAEASPAVADTEAGWRGIIACSGMILFDKPPNAANPTGREAYVMNMYTVPAF